MRTAARPSAALVLVAVLGAVGCGADAAPTPAPTAFSLPTGQAEQYATAYLAEVHAAPEGDDLAQGAGEYVVIANNADIRIDMGGWVLETDGGSRLPLGIGRQIDVGGLLRVHSSCGTDDERAVFACLEDEAFDDDAGVVTLLDAAGTEVARLAYPAA